MEAVTKKIMCDKHGEYEAKMIMFGSKGIQSSQCPKCAAIRLEEERKAEAEKAKFLQDHRKHRMAELFDSELPARFKNVSFDTYHAQNKGQQKAKEICSRYCDEIGGKIAQTGGGLIFCGRPGTGKTHLALAIGRVVSQMGLRVVYRNLANLVREVRSTWKEEGASESAMIKNFQMYDLLIIDEIGVQSGTDNERNILFEIVNGRYENVRPTIIISNRDVKEVAELISERSVDRITEGGAIIPFNWESNRGGNAA